MDFLLKNLSEFFKVLRLCGIRASISETLDAVSSLGYVDIMDKGIVKAALSCCLAKSKEEQLLFSEAFDAFFEASSVKAERFREKAEEISKMKEEIELESSSLMFKDEQLDLPYEMKHLYSRLPDEKKQGILNFLDKTSSGKNVKKDLKPLVENIIRGQLNKYRQDSADKHGRPYPTFEGIESEAGFISEQVLDSINEKNNLLTSDIIQISQEDIPAVRRLILDLSEKIRRDHRRIAIKSSKRSRLDFKRTIQSNLCTGGVLYRLRYRSKPKKKSRLLLLCDVSASMLRFSSFALQFIHGMRNDADSTDAFIFSETAERLILRNINNYTDFENQVHESQVWKKGTNIGKSILQVLEEHSSCFSSTTLVILVSDAKTLEFEVLIEALDTLEKKAKAILWLNPIPEKSWDRIYGIRELSARCSLLDCSTLEKLVKAFNRII